MNSRSSPTTPPTRRPSRSSGRRATTSDGSRWSCWSPASSTASAGPSNGCWSRPNSSFASRRWPGPEDAMSHAEAEPRWLRWPATMADPGLAYGADYNPEQWPRSVWDDDVRAMREAGVNIVSLGIFPCAQLQPTAHTRTFGWLDDVMDLLHDHGIAVDLATATASPPPWLTTKHPEILPVTARGQTVWPGARQHWRPTSPVFRRYALDLVRTLAGR